MSSSSRAQCPEKKFLSLLNQWLPAIERVVDYTATKSTIVMRVEMEKEWRENNHLRREGSVIIDLRTETK